MNQHTSKRRQIALRFFTYGVMTLAVIVISIICLLLVLGYRFDQNSGQIEQRALLQFRSTPSGASIEVDSQAMSFNTPGKQTVNAGEHTVAMRLKGYRDWAKTFSVESGSISWLNYARFIPNKITTDTAREFDTVSSMQPSPDRRWLAMVEDKAKPTVTIVDIRNERQPRFSSLTIPHEELKLDEGQQPGSFSLVEWDFGSKYILLKHEANGRTDFIRVERGNASNTRNISQQLKVNIAKAHFRGTSGNDFYALVDGDIRRIDLGAGTISRPFVAAAHDFMLYRSDTLAFTATRDKATVAGLYKEGDEEFIVRTYQDTAPVRATTSSYFNNTYFAVSHGKQVEVVKNPREDHDTAGRVFASFKTPEDTQWLQFSSSGRFVIAQHENTYTTYDLEEDKQFTTTLAKNEGTVNAQLRWLDDYYLWTDVGGDFRMVEFDGGNQQVVADVEPGFGATLSENGKRLFTIGKNDKGKYVLQSTHMTTEQ